MGDLLMCTEVTDVSGAPWVWAIVQVHPAHDRRALEAHFAALSNADLSNRFCAAVKPEAVKEYLDQLSLTGVHSYGIYNHRLALVAACQLAGTAECLEVGISVVPAYRRKGLARALLHWSARYARARGFKALIIHSLADNVPMLSLARNFGMSVEISMGWAIGRLTLCADTAL